MGEKYKVIRCKPEDLSEVLNERTEGWKVLQVIYLYPRYHAYDIVLENPTYWLQRNMEAADRGAEAPEAEHDSIPLPRRP